MLVIASMFVSRLNQNSYKIFCGLNDKKAVAEFFSATASHLGRFLPRESFPVTFTKNDTSWIWMQIYQRYPLRG